MHFVFELHGDDEAAQPAGRAARCDAEVRHFSRFRIVAGMLLSLPALPLISSRLPPWLPYDITFILFADVSRSARCDRMIDADIAAWRKYSHHDIRRRLCHSALIFRRCRVTGR